MGLWQVLILAYGIWLAIKVLPQPVEPVNIKLFVNVAGQVLILLIAVWLVMRLVNVVDAVVREKAADPKHWLDISLVPMITMTLRILVIIISVIVVAQNLGYSVSGLVASLGLGGAALALASKDTLSNLFGSLMIVVDKPFAVGDWIKGPSFEGCGGGNRVSLHTDKDVWQNHREHTKQPYSQCNSGKPGPAQG